MSQVIDLRDRGPRKEEYLAHALTGLFRGISDSRAQKKLEEEEKLRQQAALRQKLVSDRLANLERVYGAGTFEFKKALVSDPLLRQLDPTMNFEGASFSETPEETNKRLAADNASRYYNSEESNPIVAHQLFTGQGTTGAHIDQFNRDRHLTPEENRLSTVYSNQLEPTPEEARKLGIDQQNADTSTYNSRTNRMNADTSRMNAETSIGRLEHDIDYRGSGRVLEAFELEVERTARGVAEIDKQIAALSKGYQKPWNSPFWLGAPDDPVGDQISDLQIKRMRAEKEYQEAVSRYQKALVEGSSVSGSSSGDGGGLPSPGNDNPGSGRFDERRAAPAVDPRRAEFDSLQGEVMSDVVPPVPMPDLRAPGGLPPVPMPDPRAPGGLPPVPMPSPKPAQWSGPGLENPYLKEAILVSLDEGATPKEIVDDLVRKSGVSPERALGIVLWAIKETNPDASMPDLRAPGGTPPNRRQRQSPGPWGGTTDMMRETGGVVLGAVDSTLGALRGSSGPWSGAFNMGGNAEAPEDSRGARLNPYEPHNREFYESRGPLVQSNMPARDNGSPADMIRDIQSLVGSILTASEAAELTAQLTAQNRANELGSSMDVVRSVSELLIQSGRRDLAEFIEGLFQEEFVAGGGQFGGAGSQGAYR